MKRFPYTLFPFRVSCWSVCTHWKCSLATVPWHCLPAFALLVKFSRDPYFFNSGCFPTYIGYFSKRKLVSSKFIRSEIMSFIPPSRGYRREATYTRCSQDAQQEKVRNSWAVVNYQGDLVTYQLAHMPDVGPCSFWPICFCVKLLMNFVLSFSPTTIFIVFAVELTKVSIFLSFSTLSVEDLSCVSMIQQSLKWNKCRWDLISRSIKGFRLASSAFTGCLKSSLRSFPHVDFTDCHKYLS